VYRGFPRSALAFALILPIAAGLGGLVGPAVAAPTKAADGYSFAPYVDMTSSSVSMLDKAVSDGGLKAFTAAFVIGSGCQPIWGDTLPVGNDPAVNGEIDKARSAGAQVIVSFGGAGGVELAQSCTDSGELTKAYQSVVDQLKVDHVDFDVEGAAIADTASVNRRFEAINALESANPGLTVSVTIPVFPTGPDNNGEAFLQAAKTNNTRIDVVNIMTMDYYGQWDNNGPNMGAYATQAAQGTLKMLQGIFPSASYAMIGITPMIGENDDAKEVFSAADASTVADFARSNGLGRLSFWSIGRDQSCGGVATGAAKPAASPNCSGVSQSPLDFTRAFGGGG
jgi:chitinase